MEPKFETLANLFKDNEVAQKLLICTPEEACAILMEEHNLEFTVEELNEVANGIMAALAEESSDELSGDQLDQVVGGAKSAAYYTGYYIGKTVKVAGAVIGIVGGLAALGVSW